MIAAVLVVAAASLAALLWFGERQGVARVQWPLKALTSALYLALVPRDRAWFLAGRYGHCAGRHAAVESHGSPAAHAGVQWRRTPRRRDRPTGVLRRQP